jgi:hypothetical protein
LGPATLQLLDYEVDVAEGNNLHIVGLVDVN